MRHRVRIESKVTTKDPDTGATSTTWATFADHVACSVEPLSAREFLAASELRAKVQARCVIRWRPGVDASMRLVRIPSGELYQIEGVLADPVSGREYLTLLVSYGVNDGG